MSFVALDYARLSLRDALDLAVLIEEEARDRYRELAQQLRLHHTRQAAEWFATMSGNEERHRLQLAQRRETLFGREPSPITREMIFDVEAPAYDEARAFMSLQQALQAALRAETSAHDFYMAAARAVTDPGVSALFDELCAEELLHQEMVREQMAKLPPDGGPGDAYADEPQAL